MSEYLHSSMQGPLKRNRIQLSCTHCRVGKLKCDRQSPCHQCIKRGKATQCSFPTSARRRKPHVSMQNRLQHLENLVKDVMTGQTPSVLQSDSMEENGEFETPPELVKERQARSASQSNMETMPGKPNQNEFPVVSGLVVQGMKETAYVGATHWAAILNDIEEVKGYFNEEGDEDYLIEDDTGPDISLLFQLQTPTTAGSLIDALPQRPIVDKLVSGYFKAFIPSRHLIHKPSFQKQYMEFWENPTGTSLAWVALLYALMSNAIFAALSAGENNPDGRGTHMEMINAYQRWCSQCLILSNYTQPGPNTIEALLIYMGGKFVVSKHDQIDCYLLIGAAVRLSLRVGLHRDATKVAGKFSVFQAEIRRRLWHFLVQIDLLASFHIGLPGMVQAIESDTDYPRNLRDEDFHENSTELPAGRPESEMTPMSYILCKGRISEIFGQIAAQANRLSLPAYDEVLQLDDALNQTFSKIPAFFQVVPLEIAVTDSVELIIQRFSIAVLYYKSRCVLHRKYMMKEMDDDKYTFSNRAALGASIQLLRYQSSIHDAVQPNNLLSRETWFISSLSTHDFLLAATIVYLTLVQAIERAKGSKLPSDMEQYRELTALLERSYTVWSETRDMMSEAKKASEILELMLGKVELAIRINNASIAESILESNSISQLFLIDQTSPSGISNENLNSVQTCSTQMPHISTPSSSGLQFNPSAVMPRDPIGDMLDMPMNFDWDTFDNHLRPQLVTEQSWADSSMPSFELESYNDY